MWQLTIKFLSLANEETMFYVRSKLLQKFLEECISKKVLKLTKRMVGKFFHVLVTAMPIIYCGRPGKQSTECPRLYNTSGTKHWQLESVNLSVLRQVRYSWPIDRLPPGDVDMANQWRFGDQLPPT
jgi:hypothetical protein